MLLPPHKHLNYSVENHNSNFGVVCDWIESTVLFDEEELSKSDIIDILIENSIYIDQDYCSQMVSSVWRLLDRRLDWIGNASPISVSDQRLTRNHEWQEVPAHSFSLILSLAQYYNGWSDYFGNDYTEQGRIFEEVVQESLNNIFTGWECIVTGWSAETPVNIVDVVNDAADRFHEDVGDIDKYAGQAEKEFGLDLTCHLGFSDNRGAIPILLFQCASGNNWKNKLHTPVLSTWNKLIDFKAPPIKAFALPFHLMDDEFNRRSVQVGGFLMDRYRLLAQNENGHDWLSQPLSETIVTWLEPHVNWLLEQSATMVLR